MTDNLPELNQDHLPPDMLLDPHNPANDHYMQKVDSVQRALSAQTSCMQPNHVEIIKQVFRGLRTVDIAEALECSAQNVSRIKHSIEGQRLLAYLNHYQFMIDGPNAAQRTNMAWRIAVDNEKAEPQVALAALREMNKSDHNAALIESGGPQTGSVTIIINNQVSAKGPLDE